MREQISGNVVTGVPLDNNYVPIVNFTGDQIKVLLIDIHNQSFSNIATYDMDFIESEIVEHIASMIANTPLLTPGWRKGLLCRSTDSSRLQNFATAVGTKKKTWH